MDQNLSQMHRRVAERLGPRVALRFMRDGLYHDLDWTSYRRQADRAAAALIELGAGVGDRIGILSENRFEWLAADIAVLAAGAADVPMHAPLAAKQVEYQLGHSQAIGVIVSGQQQADKVFTVAESLQELKFLVSFDSIKPSGNLRCLTWQGLVHKGMRAAQSTCRELRERENRLSRDDIATIIYTSGTTGNPKGVMLTHGNLLSNCEAMRTTASIERDDVLLSWLPYSHIYARTVDHYLTTYAESTVCLAESVDTLLVNLAETEPTWLTAVPRFYEKVWSAVEAFESSDRTKRLREIFGPRIRWLSSGGAPLPGHICKAFFDAGLTLLEGYGLTETSPVISFNRREAYKIGSVGRAIPGVEIRIAEDGEILTRGPHVMKGYWRNFEATRQTIQDGWLATGDVGELDDDGFLTITDRKKDLIITSSGKNIAPSVLERMLVREPVIDHVVLYGDGRSYLTAIIAPNFDVLAKTACEIGTEITLDGEFINSQGLRQFVADRVAAALADVSRTEQVKDFLLLGRPLSVDRDELTATLKVRRREIVRKFEQQFAAMYNSDAGPQPKERRVERKEPRAEP